MPAADDRPLSAADALERVLGNPLDDHRAGSFRMSVEADAQSRFPHELCGEAFDWGLAEYLIPEECGGKFRSIEECFAISRTLSRRDLSATIAIGASFLASLPVWLHGTIEQKNTLADLLRAGRFLSFALSERAHGADILANDATARRGVDDWRIDGTKWLINNAGHAAGATVTARTGHGVRGLTLFLLTQPSEDGSQWHPLPKLQTHGLRGSAFGGITFAGFAAQDTDVVGKPGQGLEILLQTLQISRVLVASFALGGLDTCLAAAVSFAHSRRLYGTAIVELEPVARRLVDAYAELLIGETVADGACRAVHLCPDQLPLMSACAKYLVPQLAIDSIESLSIVLGARSYLRNEHWHGIFEKMRRDSAVTALFDGSSPVNLSSIIDQLPALVVERARGSAEGVPAELFAPSAPCLPRVDVAEFDLATGFDAVHQGVAAARVAINGDRRHMTHGRQLLELLAWCQARTAQLDAVVTRCASDTDWRRSGTAFDLAICYAHLHAAGACCWKWLAWRGQSTDTFVTSGAWLVVCLKHLARRVGDGQALLDDIDRAALSRLERAVIEKYAYPEPKIQ